MNEKQPAALYLTAQDCRAVLSPGDVVQEIRRVLEWDAGRTIQWPTPRNLNIVPDRWGNHYHAKAAVLEDVPVAGIRLVSHPSDESSPVNTRFVILIDPATTLPLAIVDESWTYLQRTIASVALASQCLANPGPHTLALVGAGKLARTALRYFSTLFDLRGVTIASRRPASREALAREVESTYRIPARAADTAEDAVRDAELVLTCTSAETAVLEDAWIAPGTVVASLSTAEPGKDFVEQADLFVVDSREQLQKELQALYGQDAPGWVDATVGEVVTGAHPGRTSPTQRVLIVTEGMASQDIALAHLAYTRAVERGLGLALPASAPTED